MDASTSLADHLAANLGLHSLAALEAAGFGRDHVARAVAAEGAVRYCRGVYCSPATIGEPGADLAAVTLMVPGTVVCLLSAAMSHDLSDEMPGRIWIATPRARPQVEWPPVVHVRWRREFLEVGVETVRLAGVDVRITDLARTTVDMVRLRGVYGDEPAMKTLRDYLLRGGRIADLWHRAAALRCTAAVEPFCRLAEVLMEDIPVRRPTA